MVMPFCELFDPNLIEMSDGGEETHMITDFVP